MIFNVTESHMISNENKTVLIILYLILMIVGTAANSSILITILTKKVFHKIPHLVLLNLISCDLIQTLLSGPYFMYSLSDPPEKTETATNLCKAYLLFSYTLGYVSISSMLLISLDRYIAVIHPFFYQLHVTRTKFVIVTLLSWVLPLIACFPPTVIDNWLDYDAFPGGFCGVQWYSVNRIYVFIVVGSLFIIPTLVIFVTNICVYRVARKKLRSHWKPSPRISISKEASSNESEAISRKTSTHSDPEIRKEDRALGNSLKPNLHETLPNGGGKRRRSSVANVIGNANLNTLVSAGRRLSTLPVNMIQRFQAFQECSRNKVSKKDIQIAVATLLLIGFYLISWLPFVTTRMLKASGVSMPRWVFEYSPVFVFSAVAWDPLLILWCRNEIRQSITENYNQFFMKKLCFNNDQRSTKINVVSEESSTIGGGLEVKIIKNPYTISQITNPSILCDENTKGANH